MNKPTSKTIKSFTLGCRVNQYETELAQECFARLGCRQAHDGEQVDLCLVNTCVVTAESEAKSRKLIRRLAKKYPHAEIVVLGCLSALKPEQTAAMPGVVDVAAGRGQVAEMFRRRGLPDLPDGIERFPSRRRAYVKIHDGCRGRCSYCIVPRVRPNPTSRPPEDVLAEVRRLLAAGHREIVLTGIHLGHYGREVESGDWRVESEAAEAGGQWSVASCQRVASGEWRVASEIPRPKAKDLRPQTEIPKSPNPQIPNPPSPAPRPQSPAPLVSLLRQIIAIDGEFRLRLSSIEAAEVSEELIELMAANRGRICPHLHLPLQSGSDEVLRQMRRPYTSGQYLDCCRRIHDALDHPAIGADVIVGFPGETQADFEATCRAIQAAKMAYAHVFRFSPRHGTPAAEMPEQITERVAQERAGILGGIGNLCNERYLQSLVGRHLRVLVEGPAPHTPGLMLGTSDEYAAVVLPGGREMIGQFVAVVAQRVADGRIWAEIHH
jgi:tRNA A37 methylthiotransferase MiaB